MERIVALDPGGTIGAAIVSFDATPLWLGELPYDNPTMFFHWWRAQVGRGVVVIAERFEIMSYMPSTGRLPLHVEGWINLLAATHTPPVNVVWQSPSSRKAWQRLAELRVPSGTSKHATDAFAHALAFLEVRPTSNEVEALILC